ncbi:lysine export transcriptional regulatory protein LysG [Arthrobacter sp. Hiyo8]|jgi:LysR family transcriptional regulator (chromosome initiation inhibitor)|uniref:LysR family transcriptional regulator (Chromosome initiation inhibitor) n=1 Tax=Arthrobacter bambusae TaxID=1338426 RepID=A0AAW8DJY6_9MICC|nr:MULTISPECIES: LysR family transcriptional regulator ArgP [Arthrobacter]BAS13989.1 lysine export transcriptional regulatory protein LysG [Arthrobacter sp. Hiyo8]MDP9906531.1 LysR family transcriptional regulator (chromosome initiation inhibitor) [Arthrobacter bambusae]MDQ0130031.1 LysR family transcriptional regulator (chromosome initiation inhibitor) [Arthrobacter bambusae]MDQ0181411.1 LysR family transcriptional regulator (chromosome initiation inhibitor) [Arthrobacter bambusae]GAP58638.1 
MARFSSEQLHTFAAVLTEGTLDAAARSLNITPSAVSQRLKALEQASGRVLLQRSNPVQATESGHVVLRLARQLAQLEADAELELGLPGESPMVSVPIVVNADSLSVWFLKALTRVPAELNAVFDLHRDDEQYSTSMLRAGTVMAAVTATPEPVQGCRVEPLGSMRYRAVTTPGFRARWLPDGVDVASLCAAPAVDFDRKDEYQHRFLELLGGAARGMEPAGPRHFVPSSQEFAEAIRLGLGWGLLPEPQCGRDIADGSLVELAPERPLDVPLYWQRWRTPSRILDAVTEAVRSTAAEVLRRA